MLRTYHLFGVCVCAYHISHRYFGETHECIMKVINNKNKSSSYKCIVKQQELSNKEEKSKPFIPRPSTTMIVGTYYTDYRHVYTPRSVTLSLPTTDGSRNSTPSWST
jgi:hypothetical protein